MTNQALTSDRMRSILVVVAAIGTIAFNALASTGYINSVTPEIISGKYPTVLTPAGYAFSIWSVIYIGVLAFSIYQLLSINLVRLRAVRSLFIVSCALNCGWIYFWHREQIGVCLILIVALTGVLMLILRNLSQTKGGISSLFTHAVFGVYAGWVTAASLVNAMVYLKYIDAAFSDTAWNFIGVLSLASAAALAVLVRFKLQNYLYPLAIAWAATAIAVNQSGNTAIVVAAAICVIVCLVMAVSFVMDMKSTTT